MKVSLRSSTEVKVDKPKKKIKKRIFPKRKSIV
ncbi:hypothetical protein Avbf_02637 [Armadillidium vulgare]|nr:hypothetical protein Avbf_02637 [Armadillidium vulgare]